MTVPGGLFPADLKACVRLSAPIEVFALLCYNRFTLYVGL